MGYLSIENLYKNRDILYFRTCYATEKLHGTSSHLTYKRSNNTLTFFSGGESHEKFVALFDQEALKKHLASLGCEDVIVYGEAYGGRCQGMSATYGKELKFCTFDITLDEVWMDVPTMSKIATDLGLDSVPYELVKSDTYEGMLLELDKHRDAPSAQAKKLGMGDNLTREGVVLRPVIECLRADGSRIISKHKNEKFNERATPQKVIDAGTAKTLDDAASVANEWVTHNRLTNVLSHMKPEDISLKSTPVVIKAMIEDVFKEAGTEIVDSKEVRQAIGKKSAALFKERMTSIKNYVSFMTQQPSGACFTEPIPDVPCSVRTDVTDADLDDAIKQHCTAFRRKGAKELASKKKAG